MKNSKKQEEKNLQYIRKIPISLSLKNIKISNINKIKLNTSREKNHVFNFNEEHLKKYIKNQLLKKNRYNNSLSFKNSKIKETLISKKKINYRNLNNSQENFNTNKSLIESYLNNYKSRKSTSELFKKKEKKSNNSIQITNDRNIYYNYLTNLKENFNKTEKNKQKIKNCKSVNNIYRNKIYFNIKSPYTNRTIKLTNQNSKTSVSTYEKSENNLLNEFQHKRNLSYNINYQNENAMNYEKYKNFLIEKCNMLKFEINKFKDEKKKLLQELESLNPLIKDKEYIEKLKYEINVFKKISQGYKSNCDELTKEIIYLKAEIGKYINKIKKD